MKSFLALSLLGLSILSSAAHAEYSVVNCRGTLETNRAFSLIIMDKGVRQLRIRVNSHRERAFNPIHSVDQNVDGFTVYTFTGLAAVLEVENQILEGSSGVARWGELEFSCN